MSKLNEALGFVEEKYLDEAENYTKKRLKLKTVPLVAACAILLALGVAAVGFRYFAPGIGIVDGGVKVLVSGEKTSLGDIVIESVMASNRGDISVWVSREKEVIPTAEELESGSLPAELRVFSIIVDGVEYDPTGASLSTSGFSYYSFSGVPVTDKLTLRSFYGDTEVTLHERSASDRYYQMSFGSDNLSLFELGEGLWQAELHDDMLKSIAGKACDNSVYAYLAAKNSDGSLSFLDGNMILYGAENRSLAGLRADKSGDYSELALLFVDSSFSFDYQSDIPELRIKLPAKGESVNGGILFENEYLTVKLDSVSYDENGLNLTTSYERGKGFHDFISGFSATAVAYAERGGEVNSVVCENGRLGFYDFSFSDDFKFVELSDGDEIVVKLESIWMMFFEKGTTKESFSPNLGTTKLK